MGQKKQKKAGLLHRTATAILGGFIATAQFLIAAATGLWCGKP